MITCPACGKENEDSAFECRRCRAPLRDEMPEQQQAASVHAVTGSASLGGVCQRCETYNEPGVEACTNCGSPLYADEQAAAGAPSLEKTPPDPWGPAPDATPGAASLGEEPASLSAEISALALSDQEASEAGLSPAGNGAHPAAMPRAAPQHRRAPEPAAAPSEKSCTNCGAVNPPAAKFCSECGTPFARKAPPPAAPQSPALDPRKVKTATIQVAPSIQIDADLAEPAAESAPAPADEPLPEEQAAEAAPPEEPLPEEFAQQELAPEEAFAADPLPEEQPAPEPVPEEAPPPFQASLVVEKGPAQGTTFPLAHLENSVGASGTHVELVEDPFVAPHAATLLFAGDHLIVRDEGSANGVFVKVHDAAPLEPGDLFVAGERLFRYDGVAELPQDGEGDTPYLGAPRPQGAPLRVVEVLAGGRSGRTCHRAGPIAIGRAGCDMNFPTDALLGPRHAEVRIGDDGTALLVDLGGAPAGVFVRLRAQTQQDLEPGDVLMIGDQQLRLDVA